jgi:3-deoxy-D-manno-octulosonate 8-phosphate phosphatase KdsC-like HAD superfamily phosphatase
MKKWTKEDIDNLYNLHKQGKDFKEISILLNRSHISVDKKCQRLGLKSNYNGIKYKHDYKYTTYN